MDLFMDGSKKKQDADLKLMDKEPEKIMEGINTRFNWDKIGEIIADNKYLEQYEDEQHLLNKIKAFKIPANEVSNMITRSQSRKITVDRNDEPTKANNMITRNQSKRTHNKDKNPVHIAMNDKLRKLYQKALRNEKVNQYIDIGMDALKSKLDEHSK
jgi:hypothetical protein